MTITFEKNWPVSFYVANKTCHIQKINLIDKAIHKIGNFYDVIRRSQSPIFLLPHKNCSCRRGFTSCKDSMISTRVFKIFTLFVIQDSIVAPGNAPTWEKLE